MTNNEVLRLFSLECMSRNTRTFRTKHLETQRFVPRQQITIKYYHFGKGKDDRNRFRQRSFETSFQEFIFKFRVFTTSKTFGLIIKNRF